MIEGNKYIKLVKSFFSFLETEFDFIIVNETINGNAFYDIEYKNTNRIISISYENIEDYLEVIMFLLDKKGELPNFENKRETLHLNQLNKQLFSNLSKREIFLNSKYFSKYKSEDNFSHKILKTAKELRLYLKSGNNID